MQVALYPFLKRFFDFFAAALLLLLFSPVFLMLTLLLRWRMGTPVLFIQLRPGLHGKIFRLYKFRTMRDAFDASGEPLPDAERLTSLGRFIRKTSLDELPQLWNVLRGDMALIGPRPLLVQYLPLYSPRQARRHEVRPGITGWAQVNGRNAVDWAERFELDVWYVDHCSLAVDLRILFQTVLTVLRRKGVSSQGHATMPFFMGNGGAKLSAQVSGRGVNSRKAFNVLLTSAGRRVTLLQHFNTACQARGAVAFAGDLSSLAPALYLAMGGAIALPPIRDSQYITALLAIVRQHRIAALVPTLDPELPILAPYRREFADAGCTLLVSDARFNEITGDKWRTAQEFSAHGIDCPRSWLPEAAMLESATLPEWLYIKPRDGSASQNVFRIRREQLVEFIARVPNAIVQEELLGEEITVDAFLAPDGTPLHYVPRKRLRTMAGESITGVTVGNAEIAGVEDWCERVLDACGKLGARWAITLQGFSTARGMVLTEINARFGGGAPLAFAAGGNYPELALRILSGEPVVPTLGEYRRGLYFMRYMSEVFTDSLKWE